MGELSKLKGLGPKSERCLNEIGIHTRQDLEETGPIRAFLRLKKEGRTPPSLNFLYAMIGALEDRHWTEIARTRRQQLLLELDGYTELEKLLAEEGAKIAP